MIPLPQIDTGILIERVPALSAVKFRLNTWDHVGSRLVVDLLGPEHARHAGARLWLRVRMETYRLLATHDPVHENMRDRLEKCPPASTGDLISLLASWLEKMTGIPDTETAASLVAVILFAVANGSAMDLLPSETERVG